MDTRYRAIKLWRLIFTTCHQASGAPFADDAYTHDREGNRYTGKAFLLTPWRRNEYGEHAKQRALVIGWQQKPVPATRYLPYEGDEISAGPTVDRSTEIRSG